MAAQTHVIRTYMSFTYPVDPSTVKTLVDLDISYALTSNLVDWNDSRSLVSGLATQVDAANDKELRFKLKPQARWSDGAQITAKQVVASLDHARKNKDKTMRGLFDIVEKIEVIDGDTVSFKLNVPLKKSQILSKLTESIFGIIFIDENGHEQLSKTSGPFALKSSSKDEIHLVLNKYWYEYNPGMATDVIIRQPKPLSTSDQEGFAGDPWPNIMSSSSLMSEATQNEFKQNHYSIWNRNLDRLFFFSLGKRAANGNGRKLLLALGERLSRAKLLDGLAGYRLTDQFFPPGYIFNDPEFKKKDSDVSIPEEFKSRPIKLLGAEGRIGRKLQSNISDAIMSLTGIKPQIEIVPLNRLSEALLAGDYDLGLLTLAVNDPNTEGPVSFIFGVNPSPIIDGEGENGKFKERIARARNQPEKDRNEEYRKVFADATHQGCVLPLFHFSSIAIARDGLDLSKVPTTDETVAFASVRFHE